MKRYVRLKTSRYTRNNDVFKEKTTFSILSATKKIMKDFDDTRNNKAYVYSGRTDSNGGHRDQNNVSGLGNYHYHCGGYPAHLHPNGVCPYTSSSKSSNSKSKKSSASTKLSTSTSKTSTTKSSTTKTNTSVEADRVEILENVEIIKEGEIKTLTARIIPENTTDKSITWNSSDENIATVSKTGLTNNSEEAGAAAAGVVTIGLLTGGGYLVYRKIKH